jgi:GT2 family glycosyltransferase
MSVEITRGAHRAAVSTAGRTAAGAAAPGSSTDERVCAIVLNWKGEEDTAACIESLLAQRDVTLEILVVDNASPDGSGARLHARFPQLPYLQTEANLGYAGGNNRGIEWAFARQADWVLVVNNDTVAEPDCVRRLLDAAASDSRVAALAPLIVRYDDPDRVWFAGGRHDRFRVIGVHEHWNQPIDRLLQRTGDEPFHACSFLTGCCLLLRRPALEEVGLFRADFFAYVEDLELSMRLCAAGWRIGWVPAARLAHRVPPLEAEPNPMQIHLRDRNRRRLARDAYPVSWRAIFSLWFWPTRVLHLARYAWARDWARARAILTGMTAT